MGVFDVTSAMTIIEIGVVLSIFLFGISTSQAYKYYLSFPEDRRFLKALALSIWFGLADTTTWRMPLALVIASIFDGFISAIVSGFFIHRIQQLTGNVIIVAVCALLSLLRLLGKLGIAMLGILESQEDFLGKRKWLVIATVSVGATSDLLIAGALSQNLLQ